MKLIRYNVAHLFPLAVAALLFILPVSGAQCTATAQTTEDKKQAKEQKKRDEQIERAVKKARDNGQTMLKVVKDDLKDNYYDPNFHGMDLDTRFKEANEKIKSAKGEGQVYSIIAQVLVELNDSHTRFIPPDRLVRVDYGWRMQVIGDSCYVIAVKPGSDAATKGLRVGDLVYSIDGYNPNRQNFWKIRYSYFILKPRTNTRIVIQERNDSLRTIDLTVKFTLFGKELTPDGLKKNEPKKEGPKAKDEKKDKDNAKKRETVDERLPRYHEVNKDLIVCRMPSFRLMDKDVDKMMKKIAPYQAMILDLRSNPGGYVKTLERFVGYFFEQDIKISDRKGRKENKPMMAKARKENAFKGRLVVLVDGDSSSGSEIFARLVQLEKRGTVIGDRSSGSVMQSMRFYHPYMLGGWYTAYGTGVTNADVIMSDGKSIEHIGVMPDELLLPTGADLAARRDPVMSRAAALLNVQLSPRQASALFPGEGSTEVVADDDEKPEEDDEGKEKK